jgi:hypothetical protein
MSTYPTVRPSLTLDFQKSKQLDPRITFSRTQATGKASYVQGGVIKYADEHQARFEDKGLLIEELRANLFDESENLEAWSSSLWTKANNQAISPDGTLNAASFVPNVGTTSQSSGRAVTHPQSGEYTCSVFAKPNGITKLKMRFSGSSYQAFFDLTGDGSVIQDQNGTASILKYPNGWYKCIFTINDAVGETAEWQLGHNDTTSVDGTNGFYVWGMQVEEGSFPTSYIPTSGSALTRSADVAQITGDNFSSWYNPNESTWYAEGDQMTLDSDDNQVGRQSLFVDRYANISPQRWNANSWRGKHNNASIIPVFTTPVTPKGSTVKTTYAVDGTNGKVCVEGTLSSTGTLSTYPQNTELRLGRSDRLVVNDDWRGHISRLSYYSERLTDEQLEALTS